MQTSMTIECGLLCMLLAACSGSDDGDDSPNNGSGGGGGGTDFAAFEGTFVEAQHGEGTDCTSTPALTPYSSGDHFRFVVDQQASGGPRLMLHNCTSAADCSDLPSQSYNLEGPDAWTTPGSDQWSGPPCKYLTARHTLSKTTEGLLKRQDSLEAPLSEVNGECPRQRATDLTCTNVFVYLLTRVE